RPAPAAAAAVDGERRDPADLKAAARAVRARSAGGLPAGDRQRRTEKAAALPRCGCQHPVRRSGTGAQRCAGAGSGGGLDADPGHPPRQRRVLRGRLCTVGLTGGTDTIVSADNSGSTISRLCSRAVSTAPASVVISGTTAASRVVEGFGPGRPEVRASKP